MLVLLLSIVTGMGTVFGQWLLTRKDRRGWYVSLVNNLLWLWLIALSGTYGLLLLVGLMTVIGIKGLRNWRV